MEELLFYLFTVLFLSIIELYISEYAIKNITTGSVLVPTEEYRNISESLFYKIRDYIEVVENIPIECGEEYFIEHNPTACGACVYYIYNDDISTAHDFKIFIRKFDWFAWTTLAHEYGHYLSIKNYGDKSEDGADFEAIKFLTDFLSDKDQKILKDALDVRYGYAENYRHKRQKFNKIDTKKDIVIGASNSFKDLMCEYIKNKEE